MSVETLPCQPHSATSREAALAAADRAPDQKTRVLRALVAAGRAGLTDEELQEQLRLPEGSARARRIALTHAGVVRDSGRVRATRYGRDASVWIAVRSGEQLTLPGTDRRRRP